MTQKFYFALVLSITMFLGDSSLAWSQQVDIPIEEQALDATLDFDMPIDAPVSESTADLDSSTTSASSSTLGKDLRIGLAYQLGNQLGNQLSNQLNDFPEIVSNRLDSRLRWEHLFFQNYFISVDGKIILRAWKDQQLDSDKEISAELRMRELSLQSGFGPFSIKAGYQTIIWGEMDSAKINDVMTPWDYSEFAFTAPEDARVGQPSILADWFSGKTRIGAVVTPIPMTNRYPGGEASGLLAFLLGSEQYSVNEKLPEFGSDYEMGLRIKHNLGPSDLSLYLAQVISDDPLFSLNPASSETSTIFDIRYPRHEIIGFSGNYASGNFLWKTEAAFKNNLHLPAQTTIIRDTLEGAIGVDYIANGAYNLTLELQNQYIMPGEGTLTGMNTHNSQAMLRWSKNFFHDTLSTIYFVSYQIQYGDMTHSAAMQYAINDYWRVDLNATVFVVKNQDSPSKFVDDWDNISIRINLDI
ncbi:MAG: hypothetical protein OEX19_13585 [Gammaproteobacteria bacterium]|nr:hypothetical protein [Gammaproteobacteria bacterium]